MMEIWKDIKDYEGLYQVSNLGRVKSLNYRHIGKERILKPLKAINGYLFVILYKDGKKDIFRVHRLVAETFIPNPENKPEVNHKSENKTDNRVENIEWIWHKDNCNHGTRNERVSKKLTNGKLSKPVLQFTLDGEFVREWPSTQECGRNGFIYQKISLCCRGKQKSHKGYKWKYKE